jgi:threonine/homoserine/homoserine lactone efflux protein
MLSHLAAFAGLAAVLVAIPGPSVMLIMKNAVIHGRRPGRQPCLADDHGGCCTTRTHAW